MASPSPGLHPPPPRPPHAAPVSKFVKDVIGRRGLRVAGDAVDKIVETASEFVRIIATQVTTWADTPLTASIQGWLAPIRALLDRVP